MPGAKLPAVRLSSRAGQDEERGVQSPMVVELPVSSKFGFAWPAEPHPPVQQQPSSERGVSISSSDGESDASGIEDNSGMLSQTDQSEDIEHTSIRRPVKSQQQQTITEKIEKSLPRLSRAVSMPLPSRLGHLQNPRRPPSQSAATPPSSIPEVGSEYPQIHELSLELADSVQMMVQTLLQISPSQVFDPAKEQFSACSLSVPTTCMSAMFTSMKNLNYISANMAAFFVGSTRGQDSCRADPSILSSPPILDDFDIGELLQSVGDTLSGAAAQAGVDLVLYHGDVGMKHVSVKGDECGLSYALLHVVRQVINTASRGDSIEIGLFIMTSSPKTRDLSLSDPDTPNSECYHSAPASPVSDSEMPLSCLFDISHNFASFDTSPSTPQDPSQLSRPVSRPLPTFNTVILQRLLHRIGASLAPNLAPKAFVAGRSCELTVTLEPGCPTAINARVAVPSDDASYQLLSGARIAEEPSLEELIQFTETLRGKKVTLYASSRGSFAHHLTSYLTAWGLDVSHVSPESGVDGTALAAESVVPGTPTTGERTFGGSPLRSPYGVGLEAFSQAFPKQTPLPTPGAELRQMGSNPISFIFIDNDIVVLRERLRKLRIQQSYPLTLSRKRPPLAAHHRPRSIPNAQRPPSLSGPPVVIVHFTSLANFKLVKDIIQCDLASHQGSTSSIPEVMIIPKPAGPRRFLTALHTAVTKPIVDPFFIPIATSPLHGSFFNSHTPDTRTPSPRSPTGSVRPSNGRTNSDRSTKSPNDPLADPINLPPPSPLSMTDGMEYFSEAAAKLGASPSSGLVIQNPSGQPAGIFFHPKGKGARSASNVGMDREKAQFLVPSERIKTSVVRRPSNGEEIRSPRTPVTFSSLHSTSIPPVTPPPLDTALQNPVVGISKSKGKKSSSPRTEEAPNTPRRTSPMPPSNVLHRMTTPPISPLNETDNAPIPPSRRSSRRATIDAKQPSPQAGAKGPADTSIVVPPISVLIVDDNPINQTILSTFMKKKKIKYDVAKNGEEAVEKWRTGGFHLILMDIQMPVMDGIQATKEIRMMERMNSACGFPLCTPRSETPMRTPPLHTPSEASSTSSPYRSSVIIVALTASSLQSDRVAALAAGCNDFLTKPVSLQWLNNKIIEWGSIKALQMWADLRPEVVKSISTDQAAQAHRVARRLHVPEGRTTPSASPSRSSSVPRVALSLDTSSSVGPSPSSLVYASLPPISSKDDLSDSSDNPVSDSDIIPPGGPRAFRDSKAIVPLLDTISSFADETNRVTTDVDPMNLNEEPHSASDSNPSTGSI